MSTPGRSHPSADVKILWARSGGRCNHPDCRVECIADATADDPATPRLGRIAHIVGHSPKGPRGDASYPADKLDRYENWLLLCANHHDIVDGQENSYTTDTLRGWKSAHELWVRESLQCSMVKVTFKELDEVCSHIMSVPAIPETDMQLTDPLTKMSKNGLTNAVRGLLDMGMARADVVQGYILGKVQTDYDFPERLKAGFLSEYWKQYGEGIRGDGLFEGLRKFASGGGNEFVRAAAGLAVLCYLFQTCEVFDR